MRKALQFALVAGFLSAVLTLQGQSDMGIASYYSDSFQGRKTASGEKYDKGKLTAAHKNYPFGTFLRVTRLDNKKSVIVKVNDRGPYIKGRIVDLSRKAAEVLDIIQDGNANVKIEVVSQAEAATAAAKPPVNIEAPKEEKPAVVETPTPTEFDAPAETRTSKPEEAKPEEKKSPLIVSKPKPKPKAPTAAPKPQPASTTVRTSEEFAPGVKPVRGKDYQDFDLYKVQLLRPEKTGFGVQVASLTKYENVLKQVAELQEKWFKNILVSVEPGKDGKPVYKTILGPFPDRATAKAYQRQLQKKKGIGGFIVDLTTISYQK